MSCCRHLLRCNTSTQCEPTVYPSSICRVSVQRADMHQRHIMASTSGSSLPACLVLPARQSCRYVRPFSSSSDANRSAMHHCTASRVVRCECTSLLCATRQLGNVPMFKAAACCCMFRSLCEHRNRELPLLTVSMLVACNCLCEHWYTTTSSRWSADALPSQQPAPVVPSAQPPECYARLVSSQTP